MADAVCFIHPVCFQKKWLLVNSCVHSRESPTIIIARVLYPECTATSACGRSNLSCAPVRTVDVLMQWLRYKILLLVGYVKVLFVPNQFYYKVTVLLLPLSLTSGLINTFFVVCVVVRVRCLPCLLVFSFILDTTGSCQHTHCAAGLGVTIPLIQSRPQVCTTTARFIYGPACPLETLGSSATKSSASLSEASTIRWTCRLFVCTKGKKGKHEIRRVKMDTLPWQYFCLCTLTSYKGFYNTVLTQ